MSSKVIFATRRPGRNDPPLQLHGGHSLRRPESCGRIGRKPLDYYDNNVIGMHRLLQAVANCGVKTLVFSSSAAVYGEPQFGCH